MHSTKVSQMYTLFSCTFPEVRDMKVDTAEYALPAPRPPSVLAVARGEGATIHLFIVVYATHYTAVVKASPKHHMDKYVYTWGNAAN